MLSRGVGCAAVVATVLAVGSAASAQRREGGSATAVLQVQLSQSVQFGSVIVPAHTYRLTLSPEGFVFADVETMVLVAAVPAQITEVAVKATSPSVEVKRLGAKVEIVVKIGDQVATAVGVVVSAAGAESDVTLAGKSEAMVSGSSPAVQTEKAAIERAVQLYLSGIKDCADKAHRNRWTTDDSRFVKCLCPVLARWRLPKVKEPLRIDRPLAVGRSGFSFTAMPDGRPSDCRVWVGPAAPAVPTDAAEPASPPPPPGASP